MNNFVSPATFDAYVNLVDCTMELWTYLKAPANQIYPNLYYPFDFILHEMPFDWYYQCVMLNDFTINVENRLAQDCTQYIQREGYNLAS